MRGCANDTRNAADAGRRGRDVDNVVHSNVGALVSLRAIFLALTAAAVVLPAPVVAGPEEPYALSAEEGCACSTG